MILFALKALAGSKVELAAAVRAIQQPGEQSLPFRFRGAALVFAQLLHSVPLCLRHDRLLCIWYDEHILRIVGNPLFQLVGLGVGLEVAGAAGVFLPFQNPDDGLILPSIRILGQRLSLTAGIQSLGCENLIPFKNPGNLFRAFAVDAEVKDALDNQRGLLVQNPLVLVVRIAAVAVGRLTEVLAAGAALMQTDTDFLGGIARIPLVEQVANRSKALSVPALAVHAVVDGNEPHIVAGEDDVGVLAYGQIITTKAG